MTELRKRKLINAETDQTLPIADKFIEDNQEPHLLFYDLSEVDDKIQDDLTADELVIRMQQQKTKTPKILETALRNLPERWQNWVIRSIFGSLMICSFVYIIYSGPMPLMVITIFLQIKCFQEIIAIGYHVHRLHSLPWLRSLSWYFWLVANYYFYGENIYDYFSVAVNRFEYSKYLVAYHPFLSFMLYCVGFVWFVLSLVKKYYLKQFSLFALTHLSLLIVVTASYLSIQNVFEGLIWHLAPVAMIICNDIMAYLFGFFFGRTPLIKLSPKKTWEGFIGGGFSTIIFGVIFSYMLCHFPYFVCPITYSDELGLETTDCTPSYLFTLKEYTLDVMGVNRKFEMFPFVWHSLLFSLFSSIIGPFGGFFASGFKRAFKIKDFSDTIPGHGGIVDRFDCQFLMVLFVNVYIASFIRSPSPDKLLSQINHMEQKQQLEIFQALQEKLGLGCVEMPDS